MKWKAGIITAPRKKPMLSDTIRSVMLAGWMQPHVYAEPDTDVSCSSFRTVHPKRLGCGGNWIYALEDCLEAEPDAVILFQDDVHVANYAREYLEASWPEQAHVLWLYRGGRTTPSKHAQPGWLTTNPKRQTVYGSLAVAMRADIGWRIIEEKGATLRKRKTGFDVHLQLELVEEMGLRIYQHYPSLAQHTGRTSVLHAGMGLSMSRRATDDWIQDTREFRSGDQSKAMAGDGDDGAGKIEADAAEVR